MRWVMLKSKFSSAFFLHLQVNLSLFSPLASFTDTYISARISADWSIYIQYVRKISGSWGLVTLKRKTLISLHEYIDLSVQAFLRDYITQCPMEFCATSLHDQRNNFFTTEKAYTCVLRLVVTLYCISYTLSVYFLTCEDNISHLTLKHHLSQDGFFVQATTWQFSVIKFCQDTLKLTKPWALTAATL